MRFTISIAFVFVLSCAPFINAYGLPGEGIAFDQNSGNYVVNYMGFDDAGESDEPTMPRQAIFVPATKIDPVLGSTIRLRGAEVSYFYRVSNGSNSRQALVTFVIDPVSDISTSVPLPKNMQGVDVRALEQSNTNQIGRDALITPHGWYGSAAVSNDMGLRIGWMSSSMNKSARGLAAGLTQAGFGFSSKDISGIRNAQFRGRAPVFGYVDEGPTGEISEQLEKLRQNDFITRPAAVPAIAVPNPFDAALLLDRIRTEMNTWPGKQLLDPAFAAQLDRYLVSAAEAYRLNNPKVAKEHIHTLRKMLAKEHHHVDNDDADDEDTEEHKRVTRRSIDRLAARVLDFDLRYVLKRMEQGHDKDGRGNDEHRKDDPRKR